MNYENLKTALLNKTESLDPISQAFCQAEIETLIKLMGAKEQLASNTITSYSVNGRSVSKQSISVLDTAINQALCKIQTYIDITIPSTNHCFGIDHSTRVF